MSAKKWYETTIIVNAGLEDQGVDGVVDKTTDYIKEQGGEISLLEKWGRKRLAYPIRKKNNGYFVYMLYEATAEVPPLLERFFFLEENVIRQLTVYLSANDLAFRRKRLEERETASAEPVISKSAERRPREGRGQRNEENRPRVKRIEKTTPAVAAAKAAESNAAAKARAKAESAENAEANTESSESDS